MKRQHCSDCAAFDSLGNLCKRKSPQAMMIQRGHEMVSAGAFPATKADGWCLEFVPVEVVAVQMLGKGRDPDGDANAAVTAHSSVVVGMPR